MPNLQFSVPSAVYLDLVKRGEAYGWSEHQVAKYLVFHGLQAKVSDEELMEIMLAAARDRAQAVKTRHTVKPIGG